MSQEIKISDLSSYVSGENSCFICCASFEDRCLSLPLALKDVNFEKIFVFKSTDMLGVTGDNLNKITDAFKGLPKICDISTVDPLSTFKEYCIVFEKLIQDDRKFDFYVDITTFTRESLLILLRIMHKFKICIRSLKIIYTLSKDMDNWLSRGVSDIRSVLGFAGNFYPKKPMHLIVLTGFELERAIATIEEYEPNYISIGLGDENQSIRTEFYERNRKFVNELMKIYGSSVRNLSFSLKDPISCKNSILNHIKDQGDSNFIISPLSNKISTLGAGLVGLENKDVQLCYTKPAEYNILSYSIPDDRCLVLNIVI